MRLVFAVAGLALLAYGALLTWEFATSRTVNAVQGAAWFIGGPVVHDGIVAPAVGVVGLLLSRFVPAAWRAPVAAGVVLSAVLTLLAIPLLWRPFRVVTNPGLHDRDYGVGLAIALGVVWIGVMIAGLAQQKRHPLCQPHVAVARRAAVGNRAAPNRCQGERDATQPPTRAEPDNTNPTRPRG
jgi:hypothetical protein